MPITTDCGSEKAGQNSITMLKERRRTAAHSGECDEQRLITTRKEIID